LTAIVVVPTPPLRADEREHLSGRLRRVREDAPYSLIQRLGAQRFGDTLVDPRAHCLEHQPRVERRHHQHGARVRVLAAKGRQAGRKLIAAAHVDDEHLRNVIGTRVRSQFGRVDSASLQPRRTEHLYEAFVGGQDRYLGHVVCPWLPNQRNIYEKR
jgi:ribosomal protein L34